MISAKRVVLTSFLVDFLDVVLSLTVTLLSGSVVMLSQVLLGLAALSFPPAYFSFILGFWPWAFLS